jgi:hypothetical protein
MKEIRSFSSKLSVLPIFIDVFALPNPVNHALNRIDILGVKVKRCVEILQSLLYLPHFFVNLSDIHEDGCFLRHFLLQV